jgi:hypothetical protein
MDGREWTDCLFTTPLASKHCFLLASSASTYKTRVSEKPRVILGHPAPFDMITSYFVISAKVLHLLSIHYLDSSYRPLSKSVPFAKIVALVREI